MRQGSNDHGHDHSFGQDVRRPGESRTLIVIGITAAMMVVEIAAGIAFGSMALLADGLHMGSHAAALTVTAVAYVYARRHAGDPRYSFGTGKVNALGGFSSAVLLAMFALLMVWESVHRFLNPVEIHFDRAILVAVIGLVVNGASALVLGTGHGHGHGDHHADDHDHARDHGPHGHSHGHDHNLRAAYFHVLADALTSVLAIVALLAGKHLGLTWMDPAMGIVGAGLVRDGPGGSSGIRRASFSTGRRFPRLARRSGWPSKGTALRATATAWRTCTCGPSGRGSTRCSFPSSRPILARRTTTRSGFRAVRVWCTRPWR